MKTRFRNLNIQNPFLLTGWNRVNGIHHEDFRDHWVVETIERISIKNSKVLDVGCGSQPYRKVVLEAGFSYFSQDFIGYNESQKDSFGLHNDESADYQVDYVCDILDMNENMKFEVIICTEVLEHVPDPAQVLQKISRLLAPGGYLVITFPGLSWTHQAPFYFSSGLSPFWLQHHGKLFDLELIDGSCVGNMEDLLKLIMSPFEGGIKAIPLRVIGRIYRHLLKLFATINSQILDAPVLQITALLRRK